MGALEWTGRRVMEMTITKHHECPPRGKWMSSTLYTKQTGTSAWFQTESGGFLERTLRVACCFEQVELQHWAIPESSPRSWMSKNVQRWNYKSIYWSFFWHKSSKFSKRDRCGSNVNFLNVFIATKQDIPDISGELWWPFSEQMINRENNQNMVNPGRRPCRSSVQAAYYDPHFQFVEGRSNHDWSKSIKSEDMTLNLDAASEMELRLFLPKDARQRFKAKKTQRVRFENNRITWHLN